MEFSKFIFILFNEICSLIICVLGIVFSIYNAIKYNSLDNMTFVITGTLINYTRKGAERVIKMLDPTKYKRVSLADM